MWTIYIPGTDITLFNAIFNGVAMICNQTDFIWGFALLASIYSIFSGTTAAAMHSPTGAGGAKLTQGSMGAFIPLLLAMAITAPPLKVRVQIQSTLNGVVTVVDNIPLVIAAIPVAGSTISINASQYVNMAFQNVGTNYPALSASNNGFLNPLKALLSARTTVARLQGINKQISVLINTCASTDSGNSISATEKFVKQAGTNAFGNWSPATVTTSVNGVGSSNIAFLLWRASLNTTGTVNFSNSPDQVLSCSDAANVVAQNITDALNSAQFSTLNQGSVNGMESYASPRVYDYGNLLNAYTALRTSNVVVNNLAGGQTQANTEMMNLLFSEVVENNLACLGKEADMGQCSSAMLQANEIERANIMAAASEVPMLKYAGSFGSQLLALIIGLSPIIVMFMMFAGLEVARSAKVVVHIIVWPMLVMSVGAEIVNGMICINVAKFVQSTSGIQPLIHSQASSFYRELSLQIGVGSHIMASLPVLMGTIFSLGAASAISGTMKGPASSSDQTTNNAAPKATEGAPLLSQTSMATSKQGVGGNETSFNGSIGAVTGGLVSSSLSKEMSQVLSSEIQRRHSIDEGKSNLANWKKAFDTRDYSQVGVSFKVGEDIRKGFEMRQGNSQTTSTGGDVNSSSTNYNAASAGVAADAGAAAGGPASGLSGRISAAANTSTGANDSLTHSDKSSQTASANESRSLSNAVADVISKSRDKLKGHEDSRSLQKTLDTQKSFQETISKSETSSDSQAESQRVTDSFTAASQKITGSTIAHQLQSNDDFRKQQIVDGQAFEKNEAAQKYLDIAKKEVESGSVEKLSNPQANDAAIRWRAAALMASDSNSNNRIAALGYLTNSARAMNHLGMESFNITPRQIEIRDPKDQTGIDSAALIRQVDPQKAQGKGRGSGKAKPGTFRKLSEEEKAALYAKTIKDAITPVSDGRMVKKQADADFRAAEQAGLGPNGNGTVRRTASNVADNLRPKDEGGSNTGLARR